jgi:hypothetical protein
MKRLMVLVLGCALLWLIALFAPASDANPGGGAILRPHTIVKVFDFTTLTPGAATLPSSLSFSRASSGYSVQTGTSTVVTAGVGANNVPRAGRRVDTNPVGLVLEEGRTTINQQSSDIWNAYWTTFGSPTNGGTTTDPTSTAGGAGIVVDASGAAFAIRYVAINTTGAPFVTTSAWVKYLSGSFPLLNDNSGSNVYGTTGAWERLTETAAGNINYQLATITGIGLPTSAGNTGSAAWWGMQAESGAFPTELMIAAGSTVTRAGERLFYPSNASALIPNGRLSISFTVSPKEATAEGALPMTLWYVDANNNVSISPTTGVLTARVAGVTNTTNAIMWPRYLPLDFDVNVGGNVATQVSWRVNNYIEHVAEVSGSPLGSIVAPGALDMLCHGTAEQLSSWVRNITVYKNAGPAWVAPPVSYVATLYADPAGSGSACSFASPCSITQVQTSERAAISGSPGARVLVVLRGGTYYLASTLAFTALDRGAVWQAYQTEVPVISGGTDVTTGWVVDAGSVYKRTFTGHTRQLWSNGLRATLARSAALGGAWVVSANPTTAPDATIAGFARPQDVQLVGTNAWMSFIVRVASASGTSVTMQASDYANSQAHVSPNFNLVSWYQNARELVTSPGYWYDNLGTTTLYYQPRGGEVMNTTNIVAGNLEAIVTVTDVLGGSPLNLEFRGITFSHATWVDPDVSGYASLQSGILYRGAAFVKVPAAVRLSQVNGVTFSGCTFSHLGAAGISLETGTQHCTIQNGSFSDLSGTAITVGNAVNGTADSNPTDPRVTLSYNTIRNNTVNGNGVEFPDSTAMWIAYADHTAIEHNLITGTVPYTGISCGWGWNQTPTVAGSNSIRFNYVSTFNQVCNDGGAYYINGYQQGTLVQQNYAYSQPYLGGTSNAYYLDNGVVGVTVDQNVADSPYAAYYAQGAFSPFATGNTFTNNNETPPSVADSYAVGNTIVGTVIGPLTANALAIKNAAGVN